MLPVVCVGSDLLVGFEELGISVFLLDEFCRELGLPFHCEPFCILVW